MPLNLELKVRIDSPSTFVKALRKIADYKGVLHQTDTYFELNAGRLKLRQFLKGKAELIYYKRSEGRGPRWSNYTRIELKDGRELRGILTRIMGIKIVVKKKRMLFLYKSAARVHVDSVNRLGNFVEIESMSTKGRAKAKLIFHELVKALNIDKAQTIRGSYSDLMIARYGAFASTKLSNDKGTRVRPS
ncbi:MAG TPA: class IV adenylate cyclase [Bacteroidota bacterium]|nr:class IV adenylate cyclase [Bacteroidota bacterium]